MSFNSIFFPVDCPRPTPIFAPGEVFLRRCPSPLTVMSPTAASLTYRQAEAGDCDKIVALYKTMNSDDQGRLVMYPEEILPELIAHFIEKGRLFVACHGSRVVAILKMYIVENSLELEHMLRKELRAMPRLPKELPAEKLARKSQGMARPDNTPHSPIFARMAKFDPCKTFDFSKAPDFEDIDSMYAWNLNDIYLYYGGAYTLSEYRRQGVNFQLEQWVLFNTGIIEKIRSLRSLPGVTNLIYIYGIIESNDGLGRLRSFASLCNNLFSVSDFCFYKYRAYKPELIIRDGKLKALPDSDAGKGYGCLIRCPILRETAGK